MITFSKKIVKAFVLESGFQLFEHPMESISFSSIGEGVSFVNFFFSQNLIRFYDDLVFSSL